MTRACVAVPKYFFSHIISCWFSYLNGGRFRCVLGLFRLKSESILLFWIIALIGSNVKEWNVSNFVCLWDLMRFDLRNIYTNTQNIHLNIQNSELKSFYNTVTAFLWMKMTNLFCHPVSVLLSTELWPNLMTTFFSNQVSIALKTWLVCNWMERRLFAV